MDLRLARFRRGEVGDGDDLEDVAAVMLEGGLQPAVEIGRVDDREIQLHDQPVDLGAGDVDLPSVPFDIHPAPEGAEPLALDLVELGEGEGGAEIGEPARIEAQLFPDPLAQRLP